MKKIIHLSHKQTLIIGTINFLIKLSFISYLINIIREINYAYLKLGLGIRYISLYYL